MTLKRGKGERKGRSWTASARRLVAGSSVSMRAVTCKSARLGPCPTAARRLRTARAARVPVLRWAGKRTPCQRVDMALLCGRAGERPSPRGRAGACTPPAAGGRRDNASAQLRRRRRALPRWCQKAHTSPDKRVALSMNRRCMAPPLQSCRRSCRFEGRTTAQLRRAVRL